MTGCFCGRWVLLDASLPACATSSRSFWMACDGDCFMPAFAPWYPALRPQEAPRTMSWDPLNMQRQASCDVTER